MKIQSNAMDRIRQLQNRTLRETVGLQEAMHPDDPKKNMPLGGGSGGGVPFNTVFDPKNPSKIPGSFKAKADAAASKTKPETLGSAPSGRNYGLIQTTQAEKDAAWKKSQDLKAQKAAAGGGGAGKPPSGGNSSGRDNMPPDSDKFDKAVPAAAISTGAAGAIAIAAQQLSKDDKPASAPKPAAAAKDTAGPKGVPLPDNDPRWKLPIPPPPPVVAKTEPAPASAPKPAAPATNARANFAAIDPRRDAMAANVEPVKAKQVRPDNGDSGSPGSVAGKKIDANIPQYKQPTTPPAAKTEPAPAPAKTDRNTYASSDSRIASMAVDVKPVKATPPPVTVKKEPAPVVVKKEPAPVVVKKEPAPVVVKKEPAPVVVKKEPPPTPPAAKTPPPTPPDNISPDVDISPEAKAAGERKGVNPEMLRAQVVAANKEKKEKEEREKLSGAIYSDESVQSKARSASFVFERIRNITEGRPSQRHPLEGHDYHKKSNDELIYIAKDAHKAAEAMKGHNTKAENKYRDQANDSATVRYYRQKSGMPDWYKKKYGHLKEENVPVPPETKVVKKEPETKVVTQKKLQTGGSAGGSRYPWNYESVNHVTEAKEKTEYDYEGDMARGQLQSIISNAQRVHDMLEDNDNLAEWVQSKITLAEDYISTVANYMMSEVDEEVQIDELSSELLGRYKKSAGAQASAADKSGDYAKANKRFSGIMKATKKQFANDTKPVSESDAAYGASLRAKEEKRKMSNISGADKSKLSSIVSRLNREKKKLPQGANDTKQVVAEVSNNTLKSYQQKVSSDSMKHKADPTKRSPEKANRSVAGFAKAQNRSEQGVAEAVESHQGEWIDEAGPGLWANIHAKRQRIKQGSKERMRNPGEKGAPESGALEKARGTNEEVKGEYERKVDKYLKKKYTPDDNKPPFDAPYAKMPKADKSGAVHSPMSRAKHLAKMAGRKQAGIKENSHDGQDNINTPAKRSLSKTAGMVKSILKGAKSKNKNLDKFESDPELSSQIVKQE